MLYAIASVWTDKNKVARYLWTAVYIAYREQQ